MADSTIPNLEPVILPLSGNEIFPVSQNAVTRKMRVDEIPIPTLQDVTNQGNTTTDNIQLINDADIILGAGGTALLDNGSKLREGTIEHGFGGGISRLCANNKDDQWEDGVRYIIHDTGGFKTVIYVENSNNINPSTNDDETLSYVVGSKWKNLVTGIEYLCTSANDGDAVWLPLQGNINDLSTTTLTVDGSLCTSAEVVAFSYNISGNVVTVFLKALLDFSLLSPNNGFFRPIIIEGTEASAEGIFGTGTLSLSDPSASDAFYSILIEDGKAWCSGSGTGLANVPATITYSYIYTVK